MSRKERPVHYAEVEEATEIDNITWLFINLACEPKDGFQHQAPYSKWWKDVTCKNCLRMKPKEK